MKAAFHRACENAFSELSIIQSEGKVAAVVVTEVQNSDKQGQFS